MISNRIVSGGPELPISANLSFGQYVIENLRKYYGDKVVLINGDTDEQLTFAELLHKIVDIATGLKTIGVKKGDVVAICSENCSEFVAVTVAASCIGATVTAFNYKYTCDEMSHTMNISKPRIIVSSEAALKDLLPLFREVAHIEHIVQINGTPVSTDVLMLNNLEIAGDVHSFQPEEVDTVNDTAFIFYSSGTTGLPKGVALTHRGVVYSSYGYKWFHVYGIITTIQYACSGHLAVYLSKLKPDTYLRAIEKYKINEILAVPTIVVILAKSLLSMTQLPPNAGIYKNKNKSRLLTVTRWFHVYGIITTIQYACSGHLAVYLSKLKPDTYLRAIEKYKINEILAVPTIVVILAKSPLVTKYDLSSIAYVWCAAAPLGGDTINQAMKNLPGCKGIFQSYGLTETSLTVVQEPIISNSGKQGSCGLPMAGIEAKVVDLNTREKLGPNCEGEVCLRGPTAMKGYVGNEAATRAMFDGEGFLISGDIGYYDEDGWIYIVDRIKELIKYKGQQVAPALIETVILSHDSVAECGVVGAPDELAGELPTAFVVPKPGSNLTEDDLLNYTVDKLSPASRLRGGVIFIQNIPRNGSGKILRRELRKMLQTKNHANYIEN